MTHQWLADWSIWGWPSLANHLWLATLFSLVAAGAVALLRKGPAGARYAVWLIASAGFMLPSALLFSVATRMGVDFHSLITSKSNPGQGPSVIYQLASPLSASVAKIEESASGALTSTRGHNELFCALTLVWFAGCVILLTLWWRRRRRFRHAITSPLPGGERETQALNRVRSWLGIKREVRLSIVPASIEPGVWGVWKPVVLLPETIAEELTEAELEAVIMHEMIHVVRRDNLIANVHRLLCCIFWFYPIVWVLDRMLLTERELACDEQVIRYGGASAVYASSLVKVLRFCLGWSVAGTSNATGSNLGRRVE
ncbi:MAG: M56 family metallopeptidase, partial [Blastocatellia bacterium]